MMKKKRRKVLLLLPRSTSRHRRHRTRHDTCSLTGDFATKWHRSKEGKSDVSMKMKTEQHSDSSDVFDFHARGKLQSLTVSDLKCFLASKKMKVSGKKEELIRRVTAMLD
ncbi:hypothetical protein M5K25_018103 [Dendrobium thyrsiflorum]|uniref:SAP domain-containing protein n=1 Tax=Dendrobium thyrsiflorum TaxID=117978 RepID=A0ABD0UHD4_DENTH